MTLLEPIIHYLETCGKKRVTLQEVVVGAGRERRQVLRVLDKLAREGYLVQTADNPVRPRYGEVGPPRRNPTWKIVGDLASRPKPNPPRPQSARARVWKCIRAKRFFTKADLAVTAAASQATVDEYVRQLEKKGYVRRTGIANRKVTYILVKHNQIEPPRGLFTDDGGAA